MARQNGGRGEGAPAPNRHCILIANGTFPLYEPLGNLKTPKGDIERLKTVLDVDDGSRDRFATTVLYDGTSAQIFATLRDTLKDVAPNDLVIIYYSGHGMLNANMELFLAAKDTDGYADDCTPNVRVKFEDINGLIEKRHLRRVLVILDCCHSAAAARSDIEPRADPAGALAAGFARQADKLSYKNVSVPLIQQSESYKTEETKGEAEEGSGYYLMAACGSSQQAAGRLNTGMGVFTEHLVDGLTNDGIVTARGRGKKRIGFIPVSRLFSHVSSRMEKETPQKPLLFSRNVSGNDLILTNIYTLISPKIGQKLGSVFWEAKPTLENVSPSYILEENYTFLDWNACFDALVATPLQLVRGAHVLSFLERLDNWDPEVKTHSMKKFPPGGAPRVDTEKFELRTKEFGLIVFHKIASRLRDGSGRWCVNLNISYVQWADKFWGHVREVMQRDELWSTYAESYDPIIGAFKENQDLVRVVVDQVDGAERCLDVGAGTGNSTVQLLRADPKRHVVAIDINGKMLQKLSEKLRAPDAPEGALQRTVLKLGDCQAVLSHKVPADSPKGDGETAESPDGDDSTAGSPEGEGEKHELVYEFPDDSFDACVMMNVLFALDRPVECLREIYRVLKPGAVLSFSTSRNVTNVNKLFDKIEESLRNSGEWEGKEELFKSAKARNQEMVPIIVRHTQEDIEQYLKEAGFEVQYPPVELYVKCVLVYNAVKPRKTAVRIASVPNSDSLPQRQPVAQGQQNESG